MTDMRDDFEDAIKILDTGDDTGDDEGEKTPADGDTPDPKEDTPEPAPPVPADPPNARPPQVDPAPLDAPELPLVAQETPATSESEPAPPTDTYKAPASWTPTAREMWGELPVNAQAEISRREGEISKAMQDGSDARKLAERVNTLQQTYGTVMAAEGVNDPMQAMEGLFKTVSSLRMGTPQEKAQKMSDLIGTYGIDIALLDDVLAGSQSDPETSKFERMLDTKMAPVNTMMDKLNGTFEARDANTRYNAQQEIEKFEKTAEFISDVRSDMADLLDMSAARGNAMTLQQAYDKAILLNPEVSEIMNKRRVHDSVKTANSNAAKKKQAASSISGQQAGEGMNNTDRSLRDELITAWEGQQDN